MFGKIFILGIVLVAGPSAARAASADKTASAKSNEADFDKFDEEFGDKAKSAKPVRDPLSGYNRFMFQFNDKFYFWVGKPLTKVYGLLLPQPVRISVDRAFDNLRFPLRFVSSALQGKFKGAGRELGRFTVNSTLGIGGLFDPADHWMHIKPSDEDLGLVMGHYGVGYGFPVVLPILGQTNLRDGLGIIPNFFLHPIYYVTAPKNFMAVSAGDKFNYLSLHGEEYEKIKKDALDPYTFIRDAHIQYRENKIKE